MVFKYRFKSVFSKGQQIEDFQVDTETLWVNPETDTTQIFTKASFKKCIVTR